MLRQALNTIIGILFSVSASAAISPSDLVGTWRSVTDSSQYVKINDDLSWSTHLIVDDVIVDAKGQSLLSTEGMDNVGTFVVFLYKKNDDTNRSNVAFALGSKDEAFTEETTLSYDDLILKKVSSSKP